MSACSMSGDGEPLFLQVKEARSVLEALDPELAYGGPRASGWSRASA